MRMIERYPIHIRLFEGRGAWKLGLPALIALGGLNALWQACASGHRARVKRSGRRPHTTALIVSVGNLEAGGGGKTPFVIALAKAIAASGDRPVVVTRGWGGSLSRRGPAALIPAGGSRAVHELRWGPFRSVIEGVDHGALGSLARLVGDEGVLYGLRGLPLVVDADRNRAIEAAEELSPTHILLDDAFQHPVRRDLDIVLLDAARPLGNGRLLPLGPLRESPSSLGRADIVVLTRARGEAVPPEIARYAGGIPVFRARHLPTALVGEGGAETEPARLRGLPVLLYSGIARPASFEDTAASLGARITGSVRFADHHRYGGADVAGIVREAAGNTIVTTEKDWVKSVDLFPWGSRPLALRVEVEVEEIERLTSLLGSAVPPGAVD